MSTPQQEEEEKVENENGKSDEGSVLRQRKIMSSAKETIESASRLLRRKIPCTGHLMTPRRLWIQTVPTQECDVVLMFPSGTHDTMLMWLLSRLRAGTPGLVVHVRHHTSSDSYGFYLTAPFNVLLKAAEEVHLPKPLRSELGGGLKELVQSDVDSFDGIDCKESFFTTQERQLLVLHLLQTLRAGSSEAEVLQSVTDTGIAENLAKLKLVEGQAIVPKCLSVGLIAQVFPLHDLPRLRDLQRTWVRAFFSRQPLDSVCGYFGVKIAMYFAWLGHYTTALLVPATVGFLFWVGFSGRDQTTQDVGYVLFSFFNVLWASVYLVAWKRYSAELAYRWGTLDQRDELLVEPRPPYTGTLEVSPVTGRLEPHYPHWKRNVFRWCVSVPIIGLCLSIVFITVILILQLQEWWDNLIEARGYYFFLSYLPKILLALVITLLDEAYYKVACWLNNKALYEIPEKILSSKWPLVLFTFLHLLASQWMLLSFICCSDIGLRYIMRVMTMDFQFVNSFLSLFYIAFYLQDQEKLKEQLAALLIARQVIGNLKESALPYLLEQLRLAKLSFDLFGALSPSDERKPSVGSEEPSSSLGVGSLPQSATPTSSKTPSGTPPGNRNVSQAELESSLFKYDGTFDDHLELFIQLGYVVLFSSAFPMAATCALINNLIEIRSDAFKLCFIFQRPFGQRVLNIGCWQNAMEVMGLIAVVVNCALIGLSGQVHRMFPEMSTTQTILLIVALEHAMLGLRFLITCIIPDMPDWIATEMAKVEFARREAMRRLSPSMQSSPPPEGKTPQSGTVIGRFMVSPASHSSSGKSGSPTGSTDETACTPPMSQSYRSSGTGTPVLDEANTLTSTSASPPSTERFAPPPLDEGVVAYSTTHTPDKTSPALLSKIHDWVDSGSPAGPSRTSSIRKDGTAISRSHASPLTTVGTPPRRSREWLGAEAEASALHHHLTIGPHGGVDWARRLGLDPGGPRKSSEPEARKSTDCLASATKDLAASSDSDLLKSAPPWCMAQAKSRFGFHTSTPNRVPHDSLSDSSRTVSSQEGDEAAQACASTSKSPVEHDPSTEKKKRVKESLMKRARTVAMFSLKLKERRAREVKEQSVRQAEQKAMEQMLRPDRAPGGELGCIPLEKLISVEDVAVDLQRRKNHNH